MNHLSRLCLTLLLSAGSAFSQTAGDWSYSRANAAMTGVSGTTLNLPLQEGWTFATIEKMKGKGEMMLASAVVRNGKVYVGNKEGKFFCLELSTGKKL